MTRLQSPYVLAVTRLNSFINSIEFYAGQGGKRWCWKQAGCRYRALVEIERDFARTLTLNRPHWDVRAADIAALDEKPARAQNCWGRVSVMSLFSASFTRRSDDIPDATPDTVDGAVPLHSRVIAPAGPDGSAVRRHPRR